MPGSTRIGNLLVKKHIISREQLFQAIRFQQERRLIEAQQGHEPAEKNELGEILIELGFISRHQLKSSLGRQRILRSKVATLAITFVAPLLTVACGGGAAGSSNVSVTTKQTSSQVTQAIDAVSSSSSSSSDVSSANNFSSQSSSRNLSSLNITSGKSSVTAGNSVASASSVSSNRQRSSVSSVSPNLMTSSSVSVLSNLLSSSSSSASGLAVIDGPVLINWSPPTKRENGDNLDISEVGGYELRYKLKSDSQFTSVKITSGYTDSYYIAYLKGDYEFQIAAFDRNGLYSDFVHIN